MLKRKFDPTLPYRFAKYGRMSDPGQNKRSPDQQFATIHETICRNGHPWQEVRTYRDNGISGRYVRKRPGFQQMLRDIAAGLIVVDLIVVDTYQRFGRANELDEIRRKLMNDYGILVVAADTNFADPTGIVGKAVGMVESVVATEEGRVKCHNVVRGKKDAARLKRWPGGPAPFGYRLKPVVDQTSEMPDVFNVLEPNPDAAWIVTLMFQKAIETGWGASRMAQWLNANPEIPANFKPFSDHTTRYRLSNSIYVGTLVWGQHSTDIVNDTRVKERNPETEVERIPDFCQPLVSLDVFTEVQTLRQARARAHADARAHKQNTEVDGKLIQPLSRGLTLKYLLTGLVRCGHCRCAMRVVPSGRRSNSGRVYAYYTCPRHLTGACDNNRSVHEESLREAVVSRLRTRLFPPDENGRVPDWFPELVEQVRQELDRFHRTAPDRRASAEAEIRKIDAQLAGWSMTLGDPSVPPGVRHDITAAYEQAKCRRQQLQAELTEELALEQHVQGMFDPRDVVDRLQRLSAVLAGGNPTSANLELGRHIDTITCHRDRRIVLRGTLLGLFEGAVELLSRQDASGTSESSPSEYPKVRPRQRGRLRIDDLSADGQQLTGDVDSRLDPDRFQGLADEFVWAEEFYVERKLSWAEEQAMEVAQHRLAGATHEQLVDHFKRTIPTIRESLRHAARLDPSIGERLAKIKKIPRRRWAEDHALEVAALKVAEGLTPKALAERFGKSEPIIGAALKHATEVAGSASAPADVSGD